MNRLRPDDSGMTAGPKRGPTGGPMTPVKGGNQNPGLMSPFFPGQLGLLAQQMNYGFGGGQAANRGLLNQIYSPMQMPQPFQYSQVGADPQQAMMRKLMGQPDPTEPVDPNKYSHPDPNPHRQYNPWGAR